MINPPFKPSLPPRYVYAIVRVTWLGHGHLVVYVVTEPNGYQEQRVAFVDETGHTKWDMIAWCDRSDQHYKERRAQKMDRIVLRTRKRVRMVRK